MLRAMIDQLRTDEEGSPEAFSPFVYDDATGGKIAPGSRVIGHPTIGVGRALDVHGIDRTEADFLFARDIARCEQELGRFDWFSQLDDVRKGVLTNLAFNIGAGGVAGFVMMIGAIKRGDFNDAANQMENSRWFAQVQPSRSTRLIRQMRTGLI